MSLLLDARKKIELALEQSGIHKPIEPQLPETMHLDGLQTSTVQHAAAQHAAPATGNPAAPLPTPVNGVPPDARHSGGLGADSDPVAAPARGTPVGAPLLRSDPVAAPARGTPVGAPLLRSDPVAAGKNLFAAKATPAKRRMGIIPIATITGLVLAAGGGYYVWREISPPPMAQRQRPAPPPAAPATNTVAPATKTSVPVTNTVAPNPAPTPALASATPSPKDSPVTPRKERVTKKTLAAPRHLPSQEPATHTPQAAPDKPAQPLHVEHKQEGDAVDPTLLAGYQAYRNGDLRTAWQHYSDVLHKDAKNRDALLGLAAIAQQQSQDTIAARYYNQVLALDPHDPIAHAGMSALFGAANAPVTESRLKLLLSQQPQSTALHFALGNHYAEQSRWGDAQQAYFNAYSIDPGNAQFAFNLAVSLDHLGQGKPAIQYYQRALQLDASGSAGFDRAQTQQRLKQLSAGSY